VAFSYGGDDMEKIIQGDCLDALKTLESNSVDAVVTDPPYGLSREPNIYEVLSKWMSGEDYRHRGGGFMGKTWDSFVPGPAIWKEVFRVLKPGGHVLCFAGTRTQDLMTISLRLAGFEIRDVVQYLYFSGFPKSMDVGKQLDKRKGGAVLVDEFSQMIKRRRLEKGYSLSFMDKEVCGGSTNYSWFEGRPAGVRLPGVAEYKRIKELLDLDDRYDELIEAAEREKIGVQKNAMSGWSVDGGTKFVDRDITLPATDLAKKWDGWGTALKPAHEPIILCRKPIEKNVAYNVEKYGTGAINIDGCRIPTSDKLGGGRNTGRIKNCHDGYKRPYMNDENHMKKLAEESKKRTQKAEELGRFPANCVTTEPDAFYSKYFNITPPELSKKASKKDRNSDWRGEEINLPLRDKTPGKGSTYKSVDVNGSGILTNGTGKVAPTRNHHPTVKPVDLMSWLIRLITPPGGIVLDPFVGSGSTLVAAKREGFSYVGIEMEPEYIEIAKARTGS
jgi:DNA modification methylase